MHRAALADNIDGTNSRVVAEGARVLSKRLLFD